jgi:hypothetical protein
MVKKYFKEEGITNYVISSSGNAALAAIHAIQVHNRNNPTKLRLTVYVGKNIDPNKLKILLAVIEDANVKAAIDKKKSDIQRIEEFKTALEKRVKELDEEKETIVISEQVLKLCRWK